MFRVNTSNIGIRFALGIGWQLLTWFNAFDAMPHIFASTDGEKSLSISFGSGTARRFSTGGVIGCDAWILR